MDLFKVDCMDDDWAGKLLSFLSDKGLKGVKLGKAVVFEETSLEMWSYCTVRFKGYTDTPTSKDRAVFMQHWGL